MDQRLELCQAYTVGSDATTWRFPPGCVRQDNAHPTTTYTAVLVH